MNPSCLPLTSVYTRFSEDTSILYINYFRRAHDVFDVRDFNLDIVRR